LPPEILHLLLSYLDCTSIVRLSQTSRDIHMLCYDNSVWRQLLINHFGLKMSKQIYDANDDKDVYRYYRDHSILEQRWARGQAQARYMTGHTDSVYCIVRYNAQYLVSGSRDHSVRVWDLDTYTCIASKTHHEGSVLCLKIAGDWMVSGSSDGTCVIWRSLPCPVPVSRLRGHTSGVLDVCIVKDRWIVSASRDGTVRVWDKGSSKEIRRLEGHTGPVNALQVKDDHVLSASGDGKLKLWHIETGECLRTFVGHVRGLACARFDGNRIYSGGQDALLKIWDPISGQCLDTLAGHEQLIRTVDCCEGRVVTGSYDRTLRVWDTATGRCLLSFQNGHESWIFNALINPTQIISAGQDKRILVLDFGYSLKLIGASC
ncbi:WD40-repeat-containing domain protein, partial [Dichotomocladium elegans]